MRADPRSAVEMLLRSTAPDPSAVSNALSRGRPRGAVESPLQRLVNKTVSNVVERELGVVVWVPWANFSAEVQQYLLTKCKEEFHERLLQQDIVPRNTQIGDRAILKKIVDVCANNRNSKSKIAQQAKAYRNAMPEVIDRVAAKRQLTLEDVRSISATLIAPRCRWAHPRRSMATAGRTVPARRMSMAMRASWRRWVRRPMRPLRLHSHRCLRATSATHSAAGKQAKENP